MSHTYICHSSLSRLSCLSCSAVSRISSQAFKAPPSTTVVLTTILPTRPHAPTPTRHPSRPHARTRDHRHDPAQSIEMVYNKRPVDIRKPLPTESLLEDTGRSNPPVTSRCGSLLFSASADVRSSDDVIAFEGPTARTGHPSARTPSAMRRSAIRSCAPSMSTPHADQS